MDEELRAMTSEAAGTLIALAITGYILLTNIYFNTDYIFNPIYPVYILVQNKENFTAHLFSISYISTVILLGRIGYLYLTKEFWKQ